MTGSNRNSSWNTKHTSGSSSGRTSSWGRHTTGSTRTAATAGKSGSGSRSRRKRGGMPDIRYILLGIAAVVLLFVGGRFAYGKISEVQSGTQIEETLSSAEHAVAGMDAQALLNLIDPDIADPIRLVLAASGVNGNEAMAQTLEQLFGTDFLDSADSMLNSVTMEETGHRIYGKYSTVETLWTLNINGSEFFRYITLDMERIRQKWYITGLYVSSRSAMEQ